MEGVLVKFGDIFRHREREYVFLAETDDAVYAAKILDEDETKSFEQISERLEATNSSRKRSVTFSYVILSTDGFRNRVAHLASTDNTEHQVSRFDVITSLNSEDRKSIVGEILSNNSPVSVRLIEIVKGLNIT